MPSKPRSLGGIALSNSQFWQQLLQVWLVGVTLGMMRTALPALAEAEFGVAQGSFVLLSAFVVAFGAVKGVMNFVAGSLSERLGRKPVLVAGWLLALPVPVMVYLAPSWDWVIVATVLLGINQGLTWSMTQTAQLDVTGKHQRGAVMGLNEFSGYLGVALAGLLSAGLAAHWGARLAILATGQTAIVVAMGLAVFAVRETRPGDLRQVLSPASGWVLMEVSWANRSLAAVNQAGLVEKFVDALVWIFYPVFLYQKEVGLTKIGMITGLYGVVWGLLQLGTGHLADRIGRKWPSVGGMWLCALGVAMMVWHEGFLWWLISAAVTGVGMALLYPNLSAAVADMAAPEWRGAAIGVYRFWRDLGYAIGALLLGWMAQISGGIEAAFWLVVLCMLVSGVLLWRFYRPENAAGEGHGGGASC